MTGGPVDRVIIARTQSEAIPVLTADRAFRDYDVEIIW